MARRSCSLRPARARGNARTFVRVTSILGRAAGNDCIVRAACAASATIVTWPLR
jgi:hypothetical protein